MKEISVSIANYPLDSRLNVFGDYHRLVRTATRQSGGISVVYHLESDRGLPRKKLDEEQTQYVLETFFMRHATNTYEKIP